VGGWRLTLVYIDLHWIGSRLSGAKEGKRVTRIGRVKRMGRIRIVFFRKCNEDGDIQDALAQKEGEEEHE
jgi:hypothetical protein